MADSKLVILITGANTGIGYQAAIHLATTGKYIVLIGARSKEKAEQAISSITSSNKSISSDVLAPLAIDLTDDDSIQAAAKQVDAQYGHLDILVNNAGIASVPSANGISNSTATRRQRYHAILDTNVAGTACVTDAFVPLILKSTAAAPARRIVNVSTGLCSMQLVSEGRKPAEAQYTEYTVSKAAVNLLSLHTMRHLEADRVTVIVTSPGHCATNLNGMKGVDTAENGGRYVADAVTQGSFEDQNGKYYDKGKEIPW